MFMPLMISISALSPLGGAPVPGTVFEHHDAAERWATLNPTTYLRMEIATPGGPLPFVFESGSRMATTEVGVGFAGSIRNGDGRVPCTLLGTSGGVVGPAGARIEFAHYDSVIEGRGTGDCTRPSVSPMHFLSAGTWTKQRADGPAELALSARPVLRGDDRFDPIPGSGPGGRFSGRWRVEFASSPDAAVGVFEVDARGTARGTFLTTTGDYGHLEGRVDGPLLRLSTFDGAHAFLFHARLLGDGSISGDFWSGSWHHETWTARRDDNAALPDGFGLTRPAVVDGIGQVQYPDLGGTPRRVGELLDQSGAPARIVEVFGSWCPNCADAGAELRRLKDKYAERLAVVGLAFEVSDDFETAARQAGTYVRRFRADWPVLIAGTSDKQLASAVLPVLDRVRAFPTTIFLDRRNEIVAVHTGLSGPATGEEHLAQRAEFERRIEALLDE